MGRFAEEMEKLACCIAREREQRLDTLRRLHDDVMRLRAGAREQIGRMIADSTSRAAEQRDRLRGFANRLRAGVEESTRATGARMSRLRRDRERRRGDGLRRLRTTVAAARQASRRFLREASRSRAGAADAMKGRLVGFVADLRSRVGRLLGQSRRTVLEMRKDLDAGSMGFRGAAAREPVGTAFSAEEDLAGLRLSQRIVDALQSAGLTSVEDLFLRGRSGLMKIQGIGGATLREIEKALKRRGMHLRDE